MKVGFSINMHDEDGDVYDSCLAIWLNDQFIVKLKDIKELDDLIIDLNKVREEISELL